MGALDAEAKVIARQVGTAAFELVTAGTEVSYGVGAMFILVPDAVDYALVLTETSTGRAKDQRPWVHDAALTDMFLSSLESHINTNVVAEDFERTW